MRTGILCLIVVLAGAGAAWGIIAQSMHYDGPPPAGDFRDEWLQVDGGNFYWFWGWMGSNLGDGGMNSDYVTAFANHLIVPAGYDDGCYATKVRFYVWNYGGGCQFSAGELQYVLTYHNDGPFEPEMGNDIYRLIPPVALADLNLPTSPYWLELDIERRRTSEPDFFTGDEFWTLYNPVGDWSAYQNHPVLFMGTDDTNTETERSKVCGDGVTWEEQFGQLGGHYYNHYGIRCYVVEELTSIKGESLGHIKTLYR